MHGEKMNYLIYFSSLCLLFSSLSHVSSLCPLFQAITITKMINKNILKQTIDNKRDDLLPLIFSSLLNCGNYFQLRLFYYYSHKRKGKKKIS
jgi:hypothetical protein